MLIRQSPALKWSDVTPRQEYLNRRRFLATLALSGGIAQAAKLGPLTKSKYSTSESTTSFQAATTYNNFYEFGTDKSDPSRKAGALIVSPWSIKVDGAVDKPATLDVNDLVKLAPLEERIYRLRCVEAWSMVIPWIGFPLSELIKRVEPNSKAKYVAFESLYDPRQMPSGRYAGIDFPYKEGLRMDEAMHPLTLLCFGMYGETLPKQNGAPVRIVVPWKYGFKSIKSLVRIRFVEKQPETTWSLASPREYGFYSNVNPQVDHPRWSQGSERPIGGFFRKPTAMFNGYGEHVAGMYSGMDLKKYY